MKRSRDDSILEFEKLDSVKHLVEQEEIPKIFFESGFELENEYRQIFTPQALLTKRLLQEKLTIYCDMVESHLTHQISVRRDEVVKVMIQYNELYELVEETLPEVQLLRRKIAHLENIVVTQPLNLYRLLRRVKNMKSVIAHMEKLSAVRSCYMMVQDEHTNATNSFSLIEESKTALKDLSGIACVEGINEKLNKLMLSTKKGLVDDFVKCALQVTERDSSLFVTYVKMLTQRNYIITAISTLKDQLHSLTLSTIKSILDTGLSRATTTFSQGAQLDAKLKALSHVEFISIVVQLFDGMSLLISQIGLIHSLMLSECKNMKESSNSQTLILNIELDMNTAFQSLLETIHERCRLVFKTRNEEAKSMTFVDFTTISSISIEFIRKSEKYFGKKIANLRNILSSQSQMFLETFDKARVAKLTMFMETEKWDPVIISEDSQSLVDRFSSPQEFSPSLLKLEGVGYPVAGVLIELFKLLGEYCRFFHDNYPFINRIDLISRISSLLKLFNFQTRNQILNAGAQKTAGLTSINTKHLVLASECLHFVKNFIPIFKPWIQNETKESVKELSLLDVAKKEIAELTNKIYEKILKIMKDIVDKASQDWTDANWDDDAFQGSAANVIKSVNILGKVLKQYLITHPELLKKVFSAVLQQFVDRFKILIAYLKSRITTSRGRKKFILAIRSFTECMEKSNDMITGIPLTVLEDALASEGFKG